MGSDCAATQRFAMTRNYKEKWLQKYNFESQLGVPDPRKSKPQDIPRSPKSPKEKNYTNKWFQKQQFRGWSQIVGNPNEPKVHDSWLMAKGDHPGPETHGRARFGPKPGDAVQSLHARLAPLATSHEPRTTHFEPQAMSHEI